MGTTDTTDTTDGTDRPAAPTAAAVDPLAAPSLDRTLKRFDIVMMAVAAVLSFDSLGTIATGGGEAFIWTAVVSVLFTVPYALLFAEAGGAFPHEGGPYIWVRMAFGQLTAAVTTMFYWVTNPVWLGGSLVFIGAATFSDFIHPLGSGTFADYAFKLVFVWVSILIAVVSLRTGKWITTLGALAKLLVMAALVVTALVYGFQHGFGGLHTTSFSPTTAGFLGTVSVLVFACSGFEAPSAASDEMRDPRKDVPASVGIASLISCLSYLVPVFAIIAVVPADKVTGLGGFMAAVKLVFTVYGPAAGPLTALMAWLFVFAVLNQGSAWMIVSDRMQAMVAAEGGFFGRYFGVFHPRLQTPVRMNLLSGVTATVFTVAATVLVHGSAAAIFQVVLTVAISTLLMSYLVIVPALVVLRRKNPDAPRPYRVPFGRAGLWTAAALTFFWVLLGSWTALFPDTLEPLLGAGYDFTAEWGVGRAAFETFTLGTVAALLLTALTGYALARQRRRRG